ncbi:hypothetical protein CRG98_017710 [Punica granatum]|uniref:Uncharacterized protein n=1 Tax=Punica granatum TaxID=22663 RepID=A0A2I0JZY9_PUNGR|nr:hypothetical protein CRG98_017710 [Punica granatum]
MQDKSHPSASGLRNKPFPHWESLSIIFGKDQATCQGAEDPADAAADNITNNVSLDEGVPLGSDEGLENNSPTPPPAANNVQDQSNSSVQNQSTSRKQKANSEEVLLGCLVDSMNNIGTCKPLIPAQVRIIVRGAHQIREPTKHLKIARKKTDHQE